MRIDGGLLIDDLARIPERARALEAAGYDGAVSAEISSDPFLPLAIAAEHTERFRCSTSSRMCSRISELTSTTMLGTRLGLPCSLHDRCS